MSRATKVKYVYREVLEDFALPQPNQTIVKVLASRGNNLHEVMNEAGDKFLASMPQKFRRNVWVKRGDFLVVEPIEEGDKVKAEIISILYKQQIKYIKEEGMWPSGFKDNASQDTVRELDEDDIFVNTNRVQATYAETDEDDDTSCDDEADDDNEEDKTNDS